MANASRRTAATKQDAPKQDSTNQTDEKVDPTPVEVEATQKELSSEEISERRRKAYSAGAARLREEHKADFQKFVKEEAQKLGVTYEFQKTAAEKAAEKVAALLAEHPEIAEQLRVQTVADLPPAERPLSYSGDEPISE